LSRRKKICAERSARPEFNTALVTFFSISVLVLLILYFRNRHRLRGINSATAYEQELIEKELENEKAVKEKVEQNYFLRKAISMILVFTFHQIKDVARSDDWKLAR